MRYWKIDRARGVFDFQGEHRWGFPGITCPICGTWGLLAGMLPSVSVEGHPLEKLLLNGPLPLRQWQELRDAIRPLLPPSEPIQPGLTLGPIFGHVLNPFRVGSYHGWGFVVSEAIRDELAVLAPQIKAVEARLEDPRGDRYYELEILSHARVITTPKKEPCQVCGRAPLNYPADLVRIRDVPDLPLFRLANFQTMLIVREDLLPFFKRELGPQATYRPAELVM